MSGLLNIGLAGIGGYGESYLETLLPKARAADVRIVGVVDPEPARCRHLGELKARAIPFHPTLPSLFSESPVIDLMMIATPIHLHSPQTIFSLQHGASVLCEKPLAGTLADAMRMQTAERAAAGFVAIGFQWSFSQAIQSLKHDIMGGVLGRPIQFKSIVHFPRPRTYFSRNNWAGHIRMPSGEGVLDSPVNNATSHYLHNMLYLLGKTRTTSASPASVQAELYRGNEIENYDTAAMRVRTDCGTKVLFYTTHCAVDRLGPKQHLQFENAVVEFDAMGTGQFIARFHDGRMKNYGQPSLDRHEKIFQSIDAVRHRNSNGNTIACGIDAAFPHMLCAAAAQESSPITDFPAHLKHTIALDGETLVTVDGLPEALLRCYDHGVLPSESPEGAGWANAASVVTLSEPRWSVRRDAEQAAVPV